jgi:chorismate mutase
VVSELARGGGFAGEKVLGLGKKFDTNLSAALGPCASGELTSNDRSSFAEARQQREVVLMDTADSVLSCLRTLRGSIDNIDAAIVHMLAERFQCTRAVGKLKAQHGLPLRDPEREAEQVRRLRHLADQSQLEPDFAEKFLAFVIQEVVRQHASFPRITVNLERY